MKCPKCHYLSFEPESRCRNCGYDFAFAQEDLMMKSGDEPEGPLTDIPLRPSASESKATPITLGPIRPVSAKRSIEAESPAARTTAGAGTASVAAVAERPTAPAQPHAHGPAPAPLRRELPRRPPPPRPVMSGSPQVPAPVVRRPPPASVPPPAVPAAPAAAAPAPVAQAPVAPPRIVAAPQPPPPPKAPISVELPLFVKGTPKTEEVVMDRDPVVAVPAAPPPLSVRRRTPDPARVQATYQRDPLTARKPGPVDRDLLEDLQRLEQSPATEEKGPGPVAESLDSSDAVMPATRATAAGLDLLMLGSINVVIVWLTLRWCELSLGSIGVLPLFPLAAFLLLIDAGYLLLFTAANGQTVGKMMTGIRVVDAGDGDRDHRVGTGQAALRAICSVASIFALGAGFVPALMGSGRAFHDRIAHTRVVRE